MKRFLLALTLVLAFAPAARAQDAHEGAHVTRYERARACSVAGDHRCVVRVVRGRCTEAREYELEACPYDGGIVLHRMVRTRHVRAVDPRTAAVLRETTLSARCPMHAPTASAR